MGGDGGRKGAGGRQRALVVAIAVAVVFLVGVALWAGFVGGGSDAGSGGAGSEGEAGAATSATAPVVPTLPDEVALDRCGNDLSGLETTVWALDPATGAVRWRTTVPLADRYLLRSAAGDPQLPLLGRSVEVELDLATGAAVAYPPAGAHEVLVAPPADGGGTAALLVDGERQPPTVTVDGVQVTTAAGSTGQTTIGVTGVDQATGAPRWTVELGPADRIATLSPPVLYGDTIVVAASPPRPDEACLTQG